MQGAILKKLIKTRGYTQSEFSEKSGIPLSTLKKFFTGDSSPYVDQFITMAEILECPLEYLTGETPFLFKHRDLYTLLKDMGFNVIYNPDNEDQIEISDIDLCVRTSLSELSDKVKEFIQFEIYRLSKEGT